MQRYCSRSDLLLTETRIPSLLQLFELTCLMLATMLCLVYHDSIPAPKSVFAMSMSYSPFQKTWSRPSSPRWFRDGASDLVTHSDIRRF